MGLFVIVSGSDGRADNVQIYITYSWKVSASSPEMTSSATFAAENRIHATAAVADFTVTKQSFCKIAETSKASNFRIYHNVALDSLFILTRNGVIIYLLHVGSKSHKRVRFWVMFGLRFLDNGSTDFEKC